LVEKTDIALFKEIKEGKLSAYDKLFLTYYQALCRFSLGFVKDENAAEDLVQDLFVHLWHNRTDIDINTSVKAFLYTSVRNRSLNYIKSQAARKRHETVHFENVYNETDEEPEDNMPEKLVLIERAINDLPEKCRQIFVLSRQKNMKYNEIAEHLDLSPKTVENQMGIALKKIREFMAKHMSMILLFFCGMLK
jgi:RNA polymerase sigma-70 factor, ECF subfamily